MKKVVKVNFQVSLPVSILREDKHYIAYSPALDLSTSASSFDEAKKRFEEVVEIFFEELMQKGTLGKVLTELGWKRVQHEWRPPVVIAQETETFSIPFVN